MKLNSTTGMVGLAVIALAVLIAGAVWNNVKPSPYDEFAQCLNDEGFVEYAAHWCGACATQEGYFGTAHKKLNRFECSTPNSRNLDLCPDIESTPTWQKPDGERVKGVQSLATLSDWSGCALPE
jgi:hypothetical protein